jgi:ubiquinone biosynthesis protein UbiJ
LNAVHLLVALLEDAGNRVLRLDPDTLHRLGELQGRVVRLVFTDLQVELFLVPSAAGLRVLTRSPQSPDCTLRGRLPAFARLATGGQPGLFFSGELAIDGDVDLGHRMQHILARLEIDWEEPLSRVVGDVAAHALGSMVRGARAWQQRALNTLAEDLADYLQEERRALPSRYALDRYVREVDDLRADCERLAQRVARLQSRGS